MTCHTEQHNKFPVIESCSVVLELLPHPRVIRSWCMRLSPACKYPPVPSVHCVYYPRKFA